MILALTSSSIGLASPKSHILTSQLALTKIFLGFWVTYQVPNLYELSEPSVDTSVRVKSGKETVYDDLRLTPDHFLWF